MWLRQMQNVCYTNVCQHETLGISETYSSKFVINLLFEGLNTPQRKLYTVFSLYYKYKQIIVNVPYL